MAEIGLNLKLDGAATFTQQMKQAKDATKLLDEELKNIKNDANATNFDKASQSSTVLKDKLNILKQQQQALTQEIQKATEKYGENDSRVLKLKTQLEQLNGTIAATEAELAGTNGFAALGQNLEAIGGKLTAIGDGMSQMGTKLMPLTLALTGLGAKGVTAFAEVDKTMSLTNATMGNGAEQAELLSKAMKDAAANSTFGMNDAATATLNFARAGLTAEQAASALAPAMNLAAGEGGDLDTVSAGLTATINGFADSFDNASKYADVFAAACNNSALDVNSLSNSMSTAAPIFSAAGYSVKDAALYMGVMANAGISADVAANSLKTGMARLVSPAKEGSEAMERLGISVTNADGSMKDTITIQNELHDAFAGLSESEQIAAASAIFGKNQMSNWLALINTAPSDVHKLNYELINCAGTTDEMSEAMMTGFGGSMEKLKSSIDVAVTSLGEALAPTISLVADKIQSLVDWFNSLDSSQQQQIAQIGMLVAAIGPALVIGGKLISGIGNITSGIGGLLTKLGPMLAGAGAVAPVVIAIVAAIGLLVAGFVTLYKSNDDFREKVNNVWEHVKEFISQTAEKLKEIFSKFAELVNAIWDKWGDQIMTVVETVFSVISTVIETTLNVIMTIIDTILAAINGDWDTVFNNLKNIVETILTAIVTVIETLLTASFELIGQILTSIKTKWEEIWNNIKAFASTVWNNIKQTISQAISAVKEKVSEILTNIVTFWSNKWNEAKNLVSNVWSGISGTITTLMTKIKTGITDGFKEIINSAKNWAVDMMDNFIKGIQEKIQAVKNAINQVTSTIKANLHFSEPDKGNLKDFNSWAPDMMSQYAQAIENGRYLVQHAISDVTADVAMLENPIDAAEIYGAVQSGASNANISLSIGDREFGRALKDLGVQFV